jgi:hypothetical protein
MLPARVISDAKMERHHMGYCTISNWTVTEWTDEMEALARDKYIALLMSVGAQRATMIRTGDLSFSVLTEYADAAAAESAQARITEIRSAATQELPMTMASVSGGAVFAQS